MIYVDRVLNSFRNNWPV